MSGWNIKRIKRLFTTVPACDIVPCFICKVPYARADLAKCPYYGCNEDEDGDETSNYLCSVCAVAETTTRCGECGNAFCEESCASSCDHCDVYICGPDHSCTVCCDTCDDMLCGTCATSHKCVNKLESLQKSSF